jgi:AraC-like DNA-binding protein
MVSLRCKMLVIDELNKLALEYATVELGMVEIQGSISDRDREAFKINLKKSGLELLDNKQQILVGKIKSLIIEMVHYTDELPEINDSDFISEKLGYDYTYLSNTFTKVIGMNIQQYIILHKIERVKELLLYDEETLTDIAWKLNYSSVAHLSNQFKKVTGFTPTYYKELKQKRTQNLENL